ncbi:MAG: hypothetical protein L3J07_00180 [Candidatus Magasanikbacteria bacterium]|nr:hypothetical protein [Candidatus Magasanikbacteria bacterium]
MSDKRLKIILTIVIVPFLVWGLFTLLTKQGSKIEETQEQQQEVAIEELDIEIIDLEGPKQKYINKTHGFSFEFPDEVEYQDFGKPDYADYYVFNLANKECMQFDECGTMGIYNEWLNYSINIHNLLDSEKCNQEFIDKKISYDTGLIDGEYVQVVESLKTIENENFLIKELLYTSNYESPGTFMSAYICLDNNYIYLQGVSDINIKEAEKFNPLHKEFEEIINSLELLSN